MTKATPARKACITPLGAVWRGLVAGAIGTVAMDLLWFYRYKRGHGKDGFLAREFSSGLPAGSRHQRPPRLASGWGNTGFALQITASSRASTTT